VLVDALRSGGRPGFVWRVPPAALSRGRIGSSHELRVADTLALAESLGRQLPPLRIVAVEVGTVRGEGLSPEVAAAVEEACAAALSALAELMPRA
jgi:hydrogenase maturation protease